MSWRLVDEICPVEMENILLYDEVQGICIGYYFEPKNSFIREIDGLVLENVTRWMAFPPISSELQNQPDNQK